MLDAEEAGRLLHHHFDTVTPEEFIANVRRFNPDLAAELWGTADESMVAIPAVEHADIRVGPDAGEQARLDAAEASPDALSAHPTVTRRTRRVRGFFGGIGRSVMRLFS